MKQRPLPITPEKAAPEPAPTRDFMELQARYQATPRKAKPDYAAIHRRRK
jgi:hypothetical protein